MAAKEQRRSKDVANKAFKEALMAGAASNFADNLKEERDNAETAHTENESTLSPVSVLNRLKSKSIAIILARYLTSLFLGLKSI